MDNHNLFPIIKKNKINYNKWVNDNLEELKDIYSMIKNYDKKIDFLNECDFLIFCSFSYDNSNVIKNY